MRGSTFMQPSGATSEAGDSDAPFSAYWWRSLQDFDAGDLGRPEQIHHSSYSSRVAAAALPARLRVVRELERLALFANDSFDELRHKLLTYKAGDFWFPAGGIRKQETDIPPVVTILLVGFAGTGKSSLINLMYSVLGRAGFIPYAQAACPAGRDGRTMYLEEHNVLRSMHNGFCVFDSRGMDYDRVADGLAEVEEWMEEGVRHRQPCRGAGIPIPSSSSSSASSNSSAAAKRFIRRRVNCPIVVASLSELYGSVSSGDFCALQATRDLVHAPYIKTSSIENPILLLTHGDELTPEERIEGRVKICEYLGVSETSDVYDVPCLNEYGPAVDEIDPVTSYAVAEAVYRALVVADRTHPPKPSMKEWLVLLLSWSMCVLSAMFAFLSACCSKVAKANKDHNKFRSQYHWHNSNWYEKSKPLFSLTL